jgi:hypothetical protein
MNICRFRVEDGGPERGNVAVASEPIVGEGTCVLVEDPLVFAPSLLSTSSTGKMLGKQCWSCGALLLTLDEDWRRLSELHLIDDEDAGVAAVSSQGSNAMPCYDETTFAHSRTLYLCTNHGSSSCASIARSRLGLQFLEEREAERCSFDEKLLIRSVWNGVPPLASMVADVASSSYPLPTTRRDAVESLWRVAETLNERVWMITRWVCRLLCQWDFARPFDEFIGDDVERFAEGAPQPLNPERRGLLRYVVAVLNVLITTAFPRGGVPVPSHCIVTIQTVLRMIWALDANSHTYVVLCPLYTWYQQRRVSESSGERSDNKAACNEDASVRLERSLETLFERADHNLLHGSGVALYQQGSKFNHECHPNVRFLPSPRNRVEALAVLCNSRAVSEGQELLISYVDLDASDMQDAAARQALLLRNYGFYCSCPRCVDQINHLSRV